MNLITKAVFELKLFRQLTYDDGVNFSLNLQGAVVAVKDVGHLFQLRLLDHKVVFLLKVLLQQEDRLR